MEFIHLFTAFFAIAVVLYASRWKTREIATGRIRLFSNDRLARCSEGPPGWASLVNLASNTFSHLKSNTFPNIASPVYESSTFYSKQGYYETHVIVLHSAMLHGMIHDHF